MCMCYMMASTSIAKCMPIAWLWLGLNRRNRFWFKFQAVTCAVRLISLQLDRFEIRSTKPNLPKLCAIHKSAISFLYLFTIV